VSTRRALARVNLAAIEHNCARLCSTLEDGVQLCAVVKANGYGHGALQSARAALAGGASWLAVAGSTEALELRDSGIADVPILVMGALSELELSEALSAQADIVVWHEPFLELIAELGGGRVHVKLDSGMGRLGTRDPLAASEVAAAAASMPELQLAGIMTHFATADDLEEDFFDRQLACFQRWAQSVKRKYPDVLIHAANSAGTLREPQAHFDMVRCGVAIYGMDPFGEDPLAQGLRPALELHSYLAEVKHTEVGQSTGYGRRFIAARETHLGVLPIGYGDGWRRGLSENADVLIDGRRYPLVGTVSMDNIAVDLGPDPDAVSLRGRPAVLIGAGGDERVTAEELAERLDTINYEITCGLTARVPRFYHHDEIPVRPAGPPSPSDYTPAP
jgi:alanine racemase